VIESSFTSIADVVRTMRWGWVPFINIAVTQNFDSLKRIAQVNEPLLFLHGTADSIVPHTMSDRLYAAAQAVPPQMKKVVKIEGASHRGAMALDASDYSRALGEFLDGIVSAGLSASSTASASTAATTATPMAGAAAVGLR
jgi:alpha-beta hydrolase superfamily lysophospholipase